MAVNLNLSQLYQLALTKTEDRRAINSADQAKVEPVVSASVSRRSFMTGLTSLVPMAGSLSPMAAFGADNEIRIAFIGDSLSDGMWGGATRLVAREACLAGRFKLGRFAENGTGLTRPAKFDWVTESKIIGAKFKPTLAVVSIGLNDRQSIVDTSRARYDLGTPSWRTRYGELAKAMTQNLIENSGGVVWIGLPVLRDKISQDDALEKNAIFADAIRALNTAKARYVEPWKQNVSASDTFQPYGPDIKGAQVQIRAPDGIHFTSAGYDVVAVHLLRKVAGALNEQGIALNYPCQHQAKL